MKKMKRILVPVDFSPQTEISCRYALAVAKTTGAEIILFHSFFDQVYFTDGGFSTSFESGMMLTDEIILDFYKQKESMLHSIAEDLNARLSKSGTKGISISCRMESGNPEVQILSAIEKIHPDLIIMGSVGMGRKRVFAGSVARRIINNTNIPVVAVPEQADDLNISNVAYMTAFETSDCDVIYEIYNLLEKFNMNIFCIHVLTGMDDTYASVKMETLSGMCRQKAPEIRISTHVFEDNEDLDRLKQFIDDNSINLIAFAPHKRNIIQNLFYHGITREDLFLTQIPIMAIRPSV